MKSSLSLLLLPFLASVTLAQGDDQNSVAVTVYNANLGVVREIRNMDIPSGNSIIKITDVAQLIDPTTVHIKLNGTVLEQNYQYDLVSLDKILKKYIDKTIQLIGKNGEFVEGTLLSAYGNQIVLEKKAGGLQMLPNINDYQISVGNLPDGLITKPTLVWMVDSKSKGKQDVEVTYQTGGMNWHAEYVAVLNSDDTKLDLNSWVSVENESGTTYKNAKLKLIAGDVNLVQQNVYRDRMPKGATLDYAAESAPQFEEKELFEYHIYNLQRPTNLANNETKQISLFEAAGVKAVKRYLYSSGSYYGSNGKVAVIVEFENKNEYGLGIPMPAGKVRMFKSDGESLEFVGEDMIDHTPKNEKLKLKIGDAFDIVVEEVETDNKQISTRVREISYEVKIKNRKKEDVVVDVERNLGLNWEVLSSSIQYEKKNSQTIVFKVPVKADTETVLKYKIRYSY
ncbi:MAG: DUF4139 domain-containing protein [bacterium]